MDNINRLIAVTVILVLMLLASLAVVLTQAGIGHACTTDSDCAAWEVRQGIPESERCNLPYCPATK